MWPLGLAYMCRPTAPWEEEAIEERDQNQEIFRPSKMLAFERHFFLRHGLNEGWHLVIIVFWGQRNGNHNHAEYESEEGSPPDGGGCRTAEHDNCWPRIERNPAPQVHHSNLN
jgi:hypothetical protein